MIGRGVGAPGFRRAPVTAITTRSLILRLQRQSALDIVCALFLRNVYCDHAYRGVHARRLLRVWPQPNNAESRVPTETTGAYVLRFYLSFETAREGGNFPSTFDGFRFLRERVCPYCSLRQQKEREKWKDGLISGRPAVWMGYLIRRGKFRSEMI